MTDLLSYTFFTNALIAVVILSIAAAMIGTYIIARRLAAISGGVTHACFGGLGLGYYLGISPLVMAAVFAIASSLGVEWASSRRALREDSAIAVVWSLGMAIGVLFVFLTPGFVPELNSFLFGSILNITRADLLAFGIYTLLLTLIFATRFRRIVACAFDADFARVAGLEVKVISTVMTVMIALCIVLTIRLVGIMLLMSMFSLPQITAELFAKRFRSILWLSIIFSLAGSLTGLLLSAYIDVPCSALIVIALAAIFIIAKVYRILADRVASVRP